MLQRKSNQWLLYPLKVRYQQHGEEIEQWALPDKQWWLDFAERWDHTEIIEFIEVEINMKQRARYVEIMSMPEDFLNVYIDYVLHGVFPLEFPKDHPFMLLKTQKESLDLSNYVLDIDMRLIMMELGL